MIREKLQKIQVKRLVILNLPYFFIFYVADKGSWLYRHCLGESMVQRLGVMLVNFRLAFLSWLPSIALQDLTVGVLVAGALKLVVYYRSKNAKKFRQGVEYGSARWGNRKDISVRLLIIGNAMRWDCKEFSHRCKENHYGKTV